MSTLAILFGAALIVAGAVFAALSASLAGYGQTQESVRRQAREGSIFGAIVALAGLALILWVAA